MDDKPIKYYIEQIAKYSEIVKNLAKGSNPMMAPMMLQDLLVAMDLVNVALGKAIMAEALASARLKRAEAEAYHHRASSFLQDNQVKETSEAKKYYIPLDPEVQSALQNKAKTEAISVFLKNKLQEFRYAHDDIKKMAYSADYKNP